eukprot:CAMPEP_0183730258 /NCGR_PEP_ID=MMETSP0737-20130205/32376_1 /TAXON_ID=385413 /ORGANISM="Thalassiosira miniscula, Strain CCMP1093" /LENGTH=387 /DNA_ID=CAMNT_0025962705 /DNA_START=43 /DNA_END=1206 /DNA_ORIENTATION=+
MIRTTTANQSMPRNNGKGSNPVVGMRVIVREEGHRHGITATITKVGKKGWWWLQGYERPVRPSHCWILYEGDLEGMKRVYAHFDKRRIKSGTLMPMVVRRNDSDGKLVQIYLEVDGTIVTLMERELENEEETKESSSNASKKRKTTIDETTSSSSHHEGQSPSDGGFCNLAKFMKPKYLRLLDDDWQLLVNAVIDSPQALAVLGKLEAEYNDKDANEKREISDKGSDDDAACQSNNDFQFTEEYAAAIDIFIGGFLNKKHSFLTDVYNDHFNEFRSRNETKKEKELRCEKERMKKELEVITSSIQHHNETLTTMAHDIIQNQLTELRNHSMELEVKLQCIENDLSSFSKRFEEDFGGESRACALRAMNHAESFIMGELAKPFSVEMQ